MKDDKKSRKAPAFQLYTDDFLAGTLEMSQEEVGQFIRLLCHQWNRGSIPVEAEKQQRLTGGCVSVDVLVKFRLCEDGSLRNERLESVRTERGLFLQQQSIKGQQSAEKRRLAASAIQPELNRSSTEVQPDGQPNHQPESNSPSPSPSPIEDTKKEKALNPDLEAFRLRIGAWFKRRPDTRWSTLEIKLLKEAFNSGFTSEELDLLEQFYRSGSQYRRKDIKTLFNNWNTEFDRIRSSSPSGNNGTGAYSTNIEAYQ